MDDLEVRQLRYFVAVAEELHFGRAAGRLGMAQPPLSRSIRDLERQLGVTLFERTTRQVRLTGAGEVLLRDARTALEAVTAAAHRARNAGSASPRLRVALKADIDGGLLPQILDVYGTDPAALPPELVLGGFGAQAQAVRDGLADVALVLRPVDERGLDGEPLLTEPVLVAMAAGDPLAARTELCLADLAGRSLPNGASADDGPTASPRPGATTPVSNLAEIFSLVETGSVVFFAPTSVARRNPRPGVAYRPVSDLPHCTLAVVWPQDAGSPAVAAFVRAAVEVADHAHAHAETYAHGRTA
ncbi:DNA-binding transcriptional LysR family regulator [Streptomyces sp. SAI-135]|uniref:LysR family transcriptional regulator n=1 Tax=unclassified Streptomyces TaxID=2593676 RepID=UPI002474CBE0|nr:MULTISPECIES: LysR family transcriptional regulator [unclassified Streptomyces]MDH6521592.1 DNA-binding transcriptional LysR family regulator [Streptomyces sp. SAI-090]MDH6614309.1 DNA-binding transcriptional LysR family regulator [Streptomyces sp. SAI-135]